MHNGKPELGTEKLGCSGREVELGLDRWACEGLGEPAEVSFHPEVRSAPVQC